MRVRKEGELAELGEVGRLGTVVALLDMTARIGMKGYEEIDALGMALLHA